jgi:hypothetical protein
MSMMPRRRGFALPELLALVIVIAIALAVALLASDPSRRLARVGEDLSHLRQIAAGTASYGNDFEDQIWGLSWHRLMPPPNTPYPDLNFFNSDFDAATKQMIYLIRVRGGRTPGETPVISNLFPYASYSHVVLIDYLDHPMPSRMLVSSADERWKWANDPRGYDMGLYTPNLGTGFTGYRHPYSSSFRIGLGFHDVSPQGGRAYPTSTNSLLIPGGALIRQKQLATVAHPGQKVLMHDVVARHFGRPVWHMDAQARVPVLMVDGSAAVRSFAEANLGANPNTNSASLLSYQPSPIEPPAGPGATSYHHGPLWTKRQLLGRDFGGSDVP